MSLTVGNCGSGKSTYLYEVRVDVGPRNLRVLFAAEGLRKQVLLALSIFCEGDTPQR